VAKRPKIRRSLKEENTFLSEYTKFLEAAIDSMSVVIKSCQLCKTCEHGVQKVFDDFGIKFEDDASGPRTKLVS